MNRRSFLSMLGALIPASILTACSIYPEHHRRKPLCDPGEHDTKEKPCREWASAINHPNLLVISGADFETQTWRVIGLYHRKIGRHVETYAVGYALYRQDVFALGARVGHIQSALANRAARMAMRASRGLPSEACYLPRGAAVMYMPHPYVRS